MQQIQPNNRILTYGILFVIAFAALAQGAVESWSIAIFELALLALAAVWMIRGVKARKLEIKIPATFYPLLAFWLYGLLQSLTFASAGGTIESLSLDPEATSAVVKVLFFLLIGHLVAANFIASTEQFVKAANFLIFFGFALAVIAILQYFTWNGYFLWFIPAGPLTSSGAIGTFVNHNHFAGFMELLIPLPVALLLTGAARKMKLLYGFFAAVMILALVLSLSRGGIISLVCGLSITLAGGLIYQHQKTHRERVLAENILNLYRVQWKRSIGAFAAAFVLIAAVGAGAFWVGIDPAINRFANTEIFSDEESAQTFEDSRGWIWGNTVNIFRANPYTGAGLGSFETVYPNYSATNETLSIDRAHNDYLQILSDAGIVGGLIALWFLLTVIYTAVRGMRATNPVSAGVAIGCAGAACAMAVHSVFDFNLQLPANALLFLALTGVLARISATVADREFEYAEQVIENFEESDYPYGIVRS